MMLRFVYYNSSHLPQIFRFSGRYPRKQRFRPSMEVQVFSLPFFRNEQETLQTDPGTVLLEHKASHTNIHQQPESRHRCDQ